MSDSKSGEMRVQMEFPKERFSTLILVKVLGDDQYELLEHPGFAEAEYGDVILAIETGPQELRFREVIRKSQLTMAAYGLGDGVTFESKPLGDILANVLQNDGFWQCDLGGLLWVFFDPQTFDPRNQIESIQGVGRQ